MSESRDIDFESGGRRIAGRVFCGSNLQRDVAGLLFVHGLNSSHAGYRTRAEAVVKAQGTTCLTIDLGGHGRSLGELSRLSPRDHLGDVCAAYDCLSQQPHVARERIGVYGASYGGFLSALLVAERSVARLLLRAPALYDDRSVDVPLGHRETHPGPLQASQLFDGLRYMMGDVLILESEHDTVVPHSVIATYLEHIPHPHHEILAGAEHKITPQFEQDLVDVILAWFKDL